MIPVLYHGGFGGLRVGDLVLPPNETGAATLADHGAEHVCRRDRVYVTSHPLAARAFAALHPSGRGKVYEVELLGEVEPDPDYTGPDLSLQVERARVVRVIQISRAERNDLRRAFVADSLRSKAP